ncbi:MAG: hypothetical protein H6822_20485 [Planctomycetaceae bacterium]|nr:hypothetical protein [Planctomycetales bacterium]MCB9924568.1 hypothetical protein [Planctomycetaceae bacterium]
MSSNLASALRQRQFQSLASDAELIRGWQDASQRTAQAELLIREAMYRFAIGRITYAEQTEIFTILNFAMPSDSYISPDSREAH